MRVARTNRTAYSESTQNFVSHRVFPGMFGYLWAELRYGRIRSAQEAPVRRRTNRTEPQLGPQIPEHAQKTLCDPKFGVDFEYAVRFVRATRNHELRVKTGISSQAHHVGNGRPDRTDPIGEPGTKFWSRKPKTWTPHLSYGESEAQWLISFFLWIDQWQISYFVAVVIVNYKRARWIVFECWISQDERTLKDFLYHDFLCDCLAPQLQFLTCVFTGQEIHVFWKLVLPTPSHA